MIHLSVWDQGVEIKPEETAHLFKPFEPSNTHLSHSYSGSGPGLALVQRLAELHGGSVKVESAPGQGSRFTITIPWYNRDASWTPAQTDLATLATAFQTVMIVDDSSIAAEHIQNHLKNLGIVQVVLHHRAQSVFERVQETRPSLILLDIILPDGSGWDVLQKLKTAPETQHIPVIVISVMEDRFKAIQLGAADSLPKPIARHDLHTALSKIHQAQLAARQKNAVLIEVVHGQGVRILLAEDNDANVMLICDYLTAQGYEIIVAHNGSEAIQKVIVAAPDLILMDIQMPVVNGLDAIQYIRALPDPALAQLPIIAITALTMPGDRERCLAAGANEYINKPVHLTLLEEVIARLLQQKG